MGNRVVPPGIFLPTPADARARSLNQAIVDMYRIIERRLNEEITSDVVANIPASAGSNRIFWASDTEELYFDTASGWVNVTGSLGAVTSVTGTAPISSTGGATPVISLDNAGVTYAKIQNVSATDRLLGRATAGAGVVEEITCTAFARTILDDADAATVRATIGAGTGSGTVTDVTASSPLASSGGATPNVSVVDVATLNAFIGTADLSITRAQAGGTVAVQIINSSGTSGSAARLDITVNTATAGAADPHIKFAAPAGTFVLGIDNSASDAFVIAASSILGTSNAISISTALAVSIPGGDLTVARAASGSAVTFSVSNTSNTATSSAVAEMKVAGTSGYDPRIDLVITSGATFSLGLDNSDADAFVISSTQFLGSANVFRISTTGQATLGGGGTPTYTAGAGAGTGPTISISGTDNAGTITVTTGTTPATGTIVTVNYAATWSATPRAVILTPATATAVGKAANVYVGSGAGTTSFNVIDTVSALAASTQYIWWYQVIG